MKRIFFTLAIFGGFASFVFGSVIPQAIDLDGIPDEVDKKSILSMIPLGLLPKLCTVGDAQVFSLLNVVCDCRGLILELSYWKCRLNTDSVQIPIPAKPSRTTLRPTTAKPSTTTVRPTTAKPSTTTVRPTTAKPSTTTVRPTTAKPSTTTVRPTTAKPSTTTVRPTTANPSTTTVRSTTSVPSTTTVRPTTANPSTTTVPSTTPSSTTEQIECSQSSRRPPRRRPHP